MAESAQPDRRNASGTERALRPRTGQLAAQCDAPAGARTIAPPQAAHSARAHVGRPPTAQLSYPSHDQSRQTCWTRSAHETARTDVAPSLEELSAREANSPEPNARNSQSTVSQCPTGENTP